MRIIAALAILAALAPAQRWDLAPLQVSIPLTPFVEVVQAGPAAKWYLHFVAPYGVPLVSVHGTTGTIPVRLNLARWAVYGIGWMNTPAAVSAHFVPAILPHERLTPDLFKTDGISWLGLAMINSGDASVPGYGLATQALGPIVPQWPCDWDSSDGLRSRDIVIDSAGIPRHYQHMPLMPWTVGVTVEAWFEIL